VPELPEVEVVRRGIEPYTGSWSVTEVEVFDPRALKRHEGPVEDFVHTLTGATLLSAVRRGKFLWLPLDVDGDRSKALLVHLGMSGQLLLGDSSEQFGRLLRVGMRLENPEGDHIMLGFVDQRLFGSLAIDQLVDTGDGVPAGHGGPSPHIPGQARHIARDLLDPHVDIDGFVRTLRRRKTGVKRAILDQQVISGVGNIYADEALWRTKLHFDYPSNRLSAKKARELAANLQEVFLGALEQGGTSFDWQYVNVNGQSGYFSQSLNAYGQDGAGCVRCGSVIVREPFMNRSSFRCPKCQPRPRKQVS
jgi:formamidopyrimidine-DNA glycosylase